MTDLTIEVVHEYENNHSGLLVGHAFHPPPWTAAEESAVRWMRGRLALLTVELIPAMTWQIHHCRCHEGWGLTYHLRGVAPLPGRRDTSDDTFETVYPSSDDICRISLYAPQFPQSYDETPTELELIVPTKNVKAWRSRIDAALAPLFQPDAL